MAFRIGFSDDQARPSITALATIACLLVFALSAPTLSQSDPLAPGQLRFSAAERVEVEESINVVLAVERINGTAGIVEVAFRTIDGSAVAGEDYVSSQGSLTWSDGSSQTKFVLVSIEEDLLDEPDETFTVVLSNPTGGASLVAPSTATVTIVDDDVDVPQPGRIQFTASQFTVAETQGSRSISVQRVDGTEGPVTVSYTTNDGSATAGNDYGAASGILEWNDGEGGQKTFEIPIFDDDLDEGNETVNLSLFGPTGGAVLGTSGATLSILDDDGEPGACVEDPTTLCLQGNRRFRVQVEWRTPSGDMGPGRVAPIGQSDSGLFYFFDPDNSEILVKVLDGCSVNGHFWVFSAAATNVEYTMTVTDTQTSMSAIYTNELGAPAPAITDTQAFATCP